VDGDADEPIDWWISDLPPVTDPVAPNGRWLNDCP
jgi:hypothetical protein